MSNNVVIAIFEEDDEAKKAFEALCDAPTGEGYAVAEAALIKNDDGAVEVLGGFGISEAGDGVPKGIVIGSLVGIIGGPLGVILGAHVGAWQGLKAEAARAADSASVVAVVASKIYEGETAIAALVSEDEPAFDAAFEGCEATILRYDAIDIADDVDRMYELEDEICTQVYSELKADRKAAREERREERRAAFESQMDELLNTIGIKDE